VLMGQVTVLGVWQRLLMVAISPGWLFATVPDRARSSRAA
jgi:hypothetical protein